MAGFFNDNYDAISNFSAAVEKRLQSESSNKELYLLRQALKAVSFNRDEYDAIAVVSVAERGVMLLTALQAPLTDEKISSALLHLALFIREATLIRQTRSDSEQEVLDHFLGTKPDGGSDPWSGYHLDYLRYVLPVRVIERTLAGIKELRSQVGEEQKASIAGADALENRISGYKDELKKLASQYNFVALSHAFQGLLGEKRSERNAVFSLVVALGFVSALLPLILLFHADGIGHLAGSGVEIWSPGTVIRMLASVGVEIVFLYFFRVALRSYLVVRSQVTNLQLRLSLCAFVEGYLEFAAKAASSKATSAISSFESLIFGALPAEDSALPATIDGIEQLAKIAQAVRG